MRYYISFIAVLLFSTFYKGQVKEGLVIPKKPKIGLSLSGGGAKGFAHIGVLKILDSLGVKVDYISGTSMGAIVGGLYASGYNAKDIEKIVMDTDFYTLIANEKNRQETTFFNKSTDKYLLTVPIKNGKINVLPKAISSGQKNIYMLKELFKNVSNIQDFSKLPIPFMCVATNLESGKMELFEKGDLVKAIMASSAFPSLMDPVKIGDSLYIDGAMTVNYPSKPLKDKGIDLVIGVDLSQETLVKTAPHWQVGSKINLERAMRASDRFGGHVVSGHVDGVGEILSVQPLEGAYVMHVRAPDLLAPYLMPKGSITVDGVSLTVVDSGGPAGSKPDLQANEFTLWLVPHTLEVTTLGEWQIGRQVNLEADQMAKYIERLLAFREARVGNG